MSDAALRSAEGFILILILVSYGLIYTVRRLRRRRPDLAIGLPILVGVSLRLLAVVAINASGLQSQLRGGDETTFLDWAHMLAGSPWGRGFLPHKIYQLHTVLLGIQIKLLHPSTTALRITQIGLATLGIILILAAVYDLAGARPARLAAWLLAFEPASIFFNSEIHKEPMMVLASGLVVFGGTKIWQRLDLRGIALCALGGLIAVETRSYAGWFLVIAAVALLLHAALRQLNRPLRAMPIVIAIAIATLLLAPTLQRITSKKSLHTLQTNQNYTTQTQAAANSGGPNADNLALEDVNFSSRGAVITHLPIRVFDLIFRPYPWQLQDTSQRLGAVGTLLSIVCAVLLIGYAFQRRRHVFADIGPMIYPMFFMSIAYALSAGNAGTGFRYRTDLLPIAVGALVVLREHALRARDANYSVAAQSAHRTLQSPPDARRLQPA